MSAWKQMFTFTRPERNGIAVLSLLMAGTIGYLFLQPLLFEPANVPSELPSGYDAELYTAAAARDSSVVKREQREHPDLAFLAGQKTVYQQNELFLFNPNGLPEADWVRLGLSPAQAKSVKNFENKGGVFRTKEDVKKLYVISQEKYNILEPYIVIPQRKDSTGYAQKPKAVTVLELNTVGTTQLAKVNGIDSLTAHRIVSYRYQLGGFHSKEQLHEVYGMDEARYNSVQASFTCDPSYVTKINVNTAEVSDLKNHPYVTPGIATALVNYRKQHGNYKSLPDIMQCKVITPAVYAKLSPYLSI